MRVAILGTGAMGGAMARTLHGAGFDLTLYNRTRDRAEAVAADTDAAVVDTPRDAVGDADVAITMLADRAAVDQVYRGADGLIAGIGRGTVACEMSTVEPQVSRELAPDVRARGADLLDAPVSGSVSTVESAGLAIMVGGEAEALERARPVLDALSAKIFHMGDVGSGAAMKLAVNAVIHGLNQALSEALVLAESAGLDRAQVYEVIASGAAAAPFVHYKREAFEHPDDAGVAFRLALAQKDLELILALAEETGAPMAQARTNLDVATEASHDLGERDMSALAVHLRRLR